MSSAPAPAKEGDQPGGKKPGGKKKLLVVLLALLVLGGGAGGWFSGFIPKMLGKAEPSEHAAGHEPGHEAGHAEGHGAEPSKEHGAAHAEAKAEGGTKPENGAKAPIFMDLPDIVANLSTGPNRRAVFLKLKTKLELAKAEDQATLTAAMPRVLDLFQGYLREMRPEELRGTAATYRLREELLARTNLAAPPVRVTSVLFTEMIVQ